MGRLELMPTGDDMYTIRTVEDGANEAIADFNEELELSFGQEAAGDIVAACNTRLRACQAFVELIPDEDEVILDWEDEQTQAALTVVYYSGIDHFLLCDWEMSAAILEMLLEVDPEDHLEATVTLCYVYMAMEEFDSFDEIINDVNDKYVDKAILTMWSGFVRNGNIPEGELLRFRKQFAPYYNEFTADGHPATEEYLKDIKSERPSREAQARELWLRTEHVWELFPGFIAALNCSRSK